MAKQHTPKIDEKDVNRVILRDYGADNFDLILEMMSSINVREKPRVMVACLKVARGSIDRLVSEIESAAGDWREVISDAEFPLASKKWGAIQEMTDQEQQNIYDKDRDQYQEWLNST